MKAALLLALTLLLIAPEASVAGTRWPSEQVIIYDHTSPLWDGIVSETVADMNAILPKRAPRLVYRRMAEMECGFAQPRKGAIVVCFNADAPGNAAGLTTPILTRDGLWGALVKLSDVHRGTQAEAERIACHEFMHAGLGIGENSTFDPETGVRTYALPDTSCVWGRLSDPGSFDAGYAQQVYPDKERKGKRQRHRRDH